MNVIVFGGGSIGQRHIRNLVEMKSEFALNIDLIEPNVKLYSLMSDIGVDNVFSDIDEAFNANQYKIALVCSPNHLHVEQAILSLKNGCSVFVEKPLAMNNKEIQPLRELLDSTGLFLMVGCNLRFHPGVKEIKKIIQKGMIGKPLYARSQFSHYLPNWRPGQDYKLTYSANSGQGGGILLDAIHEPDYLSWLFGDVAEVYGKLSRISELEIDVEDIAIFSMTHTSGFISEVHLDYLRRDKVRSAEICGSTGTVVWESTAKNPEKVEVRLFDAESSEWKTIYSDEAYNLNLQYIDELFYFIDCVLNNSAPMNSIVEAMHLQSVISGIRKASKNKCFAEVK